MIESYFIIRTDVIENIIYVKLRELDYGTEGVKVKSAKLFQSCGGTPIWDL